MSLGNDSSYFEQDLELRFSQLTGGGGPGDDVAYKSRSNGAADRPIDYIQQQQQHQQQHGQLLGNNMATTSHWRGDHHMPTDLSAANNPSASSTGMCADYSPSSHSSSTPMSFSGVFAPDATNMISAAAGSAAAAASSAAGGQLHKSICAVCGDRASGKHYGVYSCEGCKGFFKRTVRRELQYACRDTKNCVVDKRQRNRCQYCRYMKCLSLGMRREAVQEERQTAREKVDIKVESTTDASDNDNDMAVDMIIDAELAATGRSDSAGVLTEFADPTDDDENSAVLCDAVDRQLLTLVEWARRIPHFIELPLTDQVALLRSGWNELLIAAFAHQSTTTEDSITLARGLHVYRSNAHQAGIGVIFDRVLTELVSKMREMDMDIAELGCLRATVLFNPDAKGLSCPQYVEQLREKVYASLEEYCRHNHPEETGRFAKLLLRLPALRSIGLKCADPLFVYRLLGDAPVETFLMDLLDSQQLQQHQQATGGQASRHKTSTSET